MKTKTISLFFAIGLAAASGIAGAADQQPLATVNVQDGSRHTLDCTPPNDSADCAALPAQLHANFSPIEMNMLFGVATTSQQEPTT